MKCVIIGCGWLGLPLAEHLVGIGHSVAGSVRSQKKVDELRNCGVNLFLYNGKESHSIPQKLKNADVAIINFPPSTSENYPAQIRELMHQFSRKTKIIFTSSTGVYVGMGAVDETSEVAEYHPVRRAEKEVMDSGLSYSILRLAGLIGGGRHPVKHLSGKVADDGQQCVNLVQREDVIRAIEAVMNRSSERELFNICHPEHPTRIDYYSKKARDWNLAPPLFNTSGVEGKRVSGKLFMNAYSFEYLIPL